VYPLNHHLHQVQKVQRQRLYVCLNCQEPWARLPQGSTTETSIKDFAEALGKFSDVLQRRDEFTEGRGSQNHTYHQASENSCGLVRAFLHASPSRFAVLKRSGLRRGSFFLEAGRCSQCGRLQQPCCRPWGQARRETKPPLKTSLSEPLPISQVADVQRAGQQETDCGAARLRPCSCK
jgi:hypothetical protein